MELEVLLRGHALEECAQGIGGQRLVRAEGGAEGWVLGQGWGWARLRVGVAVGVRARASALSSSTALRICSKDSLERERMIDRLLARFGSRSESVEPPAPALAPRASCGAAADLAGLVRKSASNSSSSTMGSSTSSWCGARCSAGVVRVAAPCRRSEERVCTARGWWVHGVLPPSQPCISSISSMNGHLDLLPHGALEPILWHLVPNERLKLGTARLAPARRHRWRWRRARWRRRTRRTRRRRRRTRRARRRRQRWWCTRRRCKWRRRKWRRRSLSYTFAARRVGFARTSCATWRPVARPCRQLLCSRRLLCWCARPPGPLLDGHLLILVVKLVGQGFVLCSRRPGRAALQDVDDLIAIAHGRSDAT